MIREVDKMEDKIKIIEIDGVGFSFNANRAHERDGHVYCRQCGEQIDSEPLACLGSKKIIFSRNCRCDRETEAKRKEEEIANHIRRLKEECFATSRNLISYSFEKIIEPERQEVIIAKNFVKNFKELAKNNNGLIFHGNVGTGKTYLAACIANKIIEEYQIRVKMRNIPQIINDIEKRGFDIDKNEYYRLLCSVPLLILDDFGIERNTEYINEMVYQIINTRYEAKKPTIISTNIPLGVIMSGSNDIDKERIYSRIREMCIPVKIAGEDIRREIGKLKLNKTRELLLGER
ncbi:ATP-binding protein [Anaerosalibacter bizertensis]|jgi:DNA replication protein DnaC|nr:ATP-binding protein [Wansuia hejianensis]MBU5294657.1 ATP-binding protein [Anaerosalibacter bizertensis]MCF6462346.1 nucleoside triphosphate hydrolase [Clostridium sp. Cult1]